MTAHTNRPLCAISEEEQEALRKEAAALMLLKQSKGQHASWLSRIKMAIKRLLSRIIHR